MEGLKELYTKASTNVTIENRIMSQKEYNLRTHFIQFTLCKGVELGKFKMRNSPFWTIHLYLCENGWVHNLDVKAHGHNNDGIDLEMSQNIVIEYCTFDQGDDAIVIKAGRNQDGWRINIPSQNIIVRH